MSDVTDGTDGTNSTRARAFVFWRARKMLLRRRIDSCLAGDAVRVLGARRVDIGQRRHTGF